MATKSTGFAANEKQVILNGESSDPLHVYQITNKKELATLIKPSRPINVEDPLLKVLATRMLITVQDPNHAGVGIAAPQVGINRNFIIVQRVDKKNRPFEFYVNPKIVWKSSLLRKGPEGCLSIPDRREDVDRSFAIQLQYSTLDGLDTEEHIEGFTAVIFQHEIDHLFGILYTDRLKEQTKIETTPLNEYITLSIEKGTVIP